MMLVIAVVGVVGLFLAIKITQVIFRLVLGFLGVAAMVGAVWWFFVKY